MTRDMAFERPCDDCGTVYLAARKTSKFCGVACRVRANRRPTKVGAAAAKRTDATVVELGKTEPPPAPVYDTLAEQVRSSLTDLQALDTISGMAALRVAQQIDRGGDNGSAVATLSKELTRLVGEAKAEAAPRHRDGVTELEDRTAEKILSLVQ